MPTLTSPANTPTGQIPMPTPSAADPLANLRDIHLPADVSSLPAFGWWLVAAMILISLIGAGVLWWRRTQQRRYRGAATLLLQSTLASSTSDSEKLHQLNALLKRVAIYAYPQAGIAGLHGEQWLSFLRRSAPSITADESTARTLTEHLYRNDSVTPEAVVHFSQFIASWIAKHTDLPIENTTEQRGRHAHI